jgi:AcrR family transcriptional regulator
MAIIVDKLQKKIDIALACKGLFVKNKINQVTIAQIAETAGIAKGSIYDYFKNKEDVLFQIVNILINQHNASKRADISSIIQTREKIKIIFNIFYDSDDVDLRHLYKVFISVALTQPNEEMISFQSKCFETYCTWVEAIIQEGIDKNELVPESIKLVKGLIVMGEGMFIASSATNVINNIKKEIDDYIDVLFELIEVNQGVD